MQCEHETSMKNAPYWAFCTVDTGSLPEIDVVFASHDGECPKAAVEHVEQNTVGWVRAGEEWNLGTMRLSRTMMTSAVADMFADFHRRDKEEAAVAGAAVRGQTSSAMCEFGGAASGGCLGARSRRGPGADSDSQRTAEPTTNTPETPGSMSSEHSFMATSAPAAPPPALAAQPGGLPPYVPASAGASVGDAAVLTSSRNTNAQPHSQTPGHPSFRRQRASRACESKSPSPSRMRAAGPRLLQARRCAVPTRTGERADEPRPTGAEAPSSIAVVIVRVPECQSANTPQPAMPGR